MISTTHDEMRIMLNKAKLGVSMVTNTKLPEAGFLRITQIIGDNTVKPPIPPIVPVSRGTIHNWMQRGIFPRSIKIGPRVAAWRVSDVQKFLDDGGFQA